MITKGLYTYEFLKRISRGASYPSIVAVLVMLLLFAAQSHASPPEVPDLEDPCVEQWRANRNITSQQLSQQTVHDLIHFLRLNAPAAVSTTDGCDRVNVVLDKVRSDAASDRTGHADVAIGTGNKQLTIQSDFEQNNGQIALSGDNIDLAGSFNQGPLKGTVALANKSRSLETSLLATSGDTANLVILTGTLTKAPKGFRKNDPIVIRLEFTNQGMPLEEYIQLHLPAPGAQYCGGDDCGGVIDRAMQAIIHWSVGLYTAPTAWLVFDFVTPPEVQIYVDGSLLPTLQREWVISANKEHTIKVMQGSIVKWNATVKVPTNTVHHCPG
jgi:hypothetical protein